MEQFLINANTSPEKDHSRETPEQFLLKIKQEKFRVGIRRSENKTMIMTKRLVSMEPTPDIQVETNFRTLEGEEMMRVERGEQFVPRLFAKSLVEYAKANKQKAEEILLYWTKILFAECTTNNISSIIPVIATFRRICSIKESIFSQEMQKIDIIKLVAPYLSETDTAYEDLQIEISWLFCNFAYDGFLIVLWDFNIPENFVRFINTSNNMNLIYTAIWGLSNLSADNKDGVKRLIDLRIVDIIRNLFTRIRIEDPTHLREIFWLCSNLVRARLNYEETKNLLPLINYYILDNNTVILEYLLRCLMFMTATDDDYIEEVLLYKEIVPRLFDLTQSLVQVVNYMAIKVINNILAGRDSHIEALLSLKVLDLLVTLMKSSSVKLRKEIGWSISNLLAGSTEIIEQAFNHELFNVIIHHLNVDDYTVRKEIAIGVCNMVPNATKVHIQKLLEKDIVIIFLQLLEFEEPYLVEKILEAIYIMINMGQNFGDQNEILNIFNLHDLPSHLDKLMFHPAERVYQKACTIVESFYKYC